MEVSWFDFTSFREARSARIPRLGKYHQTSHTLITEKRGRALKEVVLHWKRSVQQIICGSLLAIFSTTNVCVRDSLTWNES